jgi:tRNA pseudouridine32 synthase/23S rRNA pseudouridine746 synthase
MAIAAHPSSVSLPPQKAPYPSILEFLTRRFPAIPSAVWQSRIVEGKVLDARGEPISLDTPYVPSQRLFYFREVVDEPIIPFVESILFCNEHILVACKPHFLPVVPAGRYVNECLVHRLRQRTGNRAITPVHRIDRDTAGLVLFSTNPASRAQYHRLFADGEIRKSYLAIAHWPAPPPTRQWRVENRIIKDGLHMARKTLAGPVNARSQIEILEARADCGLFSLTPITGKTHQLRVHMCGLGFPIQHDRIYPTPLTCAIDDYTQPLQLLAKRLAFRDPVSGSDLEFESSRSLLW